MARRVGWIGAVALCGFGLMLAPSAAGQDCRSEAEQMRADLAGRDMADLLRREVNVLTEAALAFADLGNMEACGKALAEARAVAAGRSAPTVTTAEPAPPAQATAPADRPAPPRAAPAAAPAPPPKETVYFRSGSADLARDDRTRLRRLAETAKKQGFSVRLDGYSDPTGPAELNLRLSRQRVAAVAEALVAAGVPKERIRMESHGDTRATGPGASREARRVEIELLPGDREG